MPETPTRRPHAPRDRRTPRAVGTLQPGPARGAARAALLACALALVTIPGANAAAAPRPSYAASPASPTFASHASHASRVSGAGECTFPMKKQIADRPWALRRLLLDALWVRTKGKAKDGTSIRVAVIDTGVDRANPQLGGALDLAAGKDFLDPRGGDGTADTVGHGTKVAGLIAARPQEGTGFVGLAPEATVIPIRQNDGQGNGNAATLAQAIDHALSKGAHVINISQDTDARLGPDSDLAKAVKRAVDAKVVVIASAGNDGLAGQKRTTYPAAFPDVLAVASSDRNNERAAFSQPGDFVGVAAPGVDIVSTVPGFGQCVDNGTSFSAPYVAGLAALLRAEHMDWTPQQIVWQIQNTAERTVNGRDEYVGWGVVDPVRAVTQDGEPPKAPVPDPGPPPAAAPEAARLGLTETAQERQVRLGTYALGIGVVLIGVIAGTATVIRDARHRRLQ